MQECKLSFDSFWKTTLTDFEAFNQDALQMTKFVTSIINPLSIDVITHCGTYMSKRLGNPEWLDPLKEHVFNATAQLLPEPFNNKNDYLFDAWINLSGKDDYQAIHNHAPRETTSEQIEGTVEAPMLCIMSGTYGLQIIDGHGGLFFWNEYTSNCFKTLTLKQPEKIKIDYRSGECILFSPYTYHSTGMNMIDQKRISLSFNVMIEPNPIVLNNQI